MNSVAIVGAGVVGLAHAYAFARRGWRVRVYERSSQASGASVRNFGMIWPIGQPAGERLDLAMHSRAIWAELLDAAGLPYSSDGALHLAYHADEEAVAREFADREPERARWMSPSEVTATSAAANPAGLRGALYSVADLVLDPRLTMSVLPEYLDETFGVEFLHSTLVTDVTQLEADRVIICSGHDFVTLFPAVFRASRLAPCKLQMMRTVAQPPSWRLGPALAGGLTLRFYPSFSSCTTLPALKQRIAHEMPEYDRWGIHVMASPTANNAITLGDSHEYDLSIDVFNKEVIDDLVLRYARQLMVLPDLRIAERWNGVYCRHPSLPYFVHDVNSRVRIVTGLGGAGMTLSMGLADRCVQS